MSHRPTPPLALDHPGRLAALRAAGFLPETADPTPADLIFDDLTCLAATVATAPVAFVTLVVDAERQMLLSSYGFPPELQGMTEVPRSHCLCVHAVEAGSPLLLEDARQDPRFTDHGAVRDWGVVAYAGVPLCSADGHVLGTLAVADREPRAWTHAERRALARVARLAGAELARRQEMQERARAEEALRTSEERFRRFVEHASDVLLMLDETATIQFASPVMARIFGHPPEGVLGTPALSLVHPDDWPAAQDAITRALAAPGTTQGAEVRVRDAAGTWRCCEAVGRTEGPGSAVPGLLISLRDVTAWREVEAARRATDARFRALIEHAHDVVGVIALDGTILYESPAVERVLGLRPDQLVGRHAAELVHPDDLPQVGAALARLAEAPGTRTTLTYRCRHADGSWRTLEAEAWNLSDEAAVGGVVVNAHDVTEREALEAQLRQSQKMEAVGQLAGGVAHDFNNLLTVISANLRFAREALPPHAPAQADLETAEEAATRAAQLTRQLLAFSRKQVLKPERLDLHRVVAGMIPMLRRLIGEDVAILTAPTASRRAVLADPGQLEQVLLNLALNARDAMPHGGRLVIETADVTVTPAEAARRGAEVAPGAYVRLTVRDTGVGMDAATLGRIFEPFFTTKAPGHGTGLGLATVYGIVRQSGGHVCVVSEPGQGTTFEIDLPAVPAAGSAPAEDPAAPALPGRGTVLLVEDEAALRRSVHRMLTRAGYAVLEAAHGEAALDVLRTHTGGLDLVLTDVVMPGLSGRALAERLATLRPDVPVLFMSGYTDDEILRRGVVASGVRLLEKPFTHEALLEAVRGALES